MKTSNYTMYGAPLLLILSILFSVEANAQWSLAKSFGIQGNNEYTRGIGTDAQNNLYVIGKYSDSDPQHDFDGQPLIGLPTVWGSNHGLVFAKYDASNNLQFVKSYRAMKDTAEASQIEDARMAVASNGDVFIAATYRFSVEIEGQTLTATQTGFGESNLFVAKFDNSGNLSWLKNVDTYGGTCKDVAVTSTGDVIVGGSYKQAIDFGNGMSNSGSSSRDWGFLCKLAGSDGTAQALEIFDGGHPTNITMGASGEMMVIGQFKKNQIDFSDGTTLMLKTPETSSNLKLNNFVAKFSSALAPVWIEQVRGNSQGTAEVTWVANNVKLMLNNTHYLAMGTDSIDGTTHAVVNIDPANGNVNTIVEAGDFLYSMASNANSTYLFTERAQFNEFTFGSYNIPMSDEFAFFAIDNNDSIQWINMIDASHSSIMNANLMMATDNDVVLGGSMAYCDTVYLSTTSYVTCNDNLYTSGWFARYSLSGGVSVDENDVALNLSVYPNPATDYIMLECVNDDFVNGNWQILGTDGRAYNTGNITEKSAEISIDNLPEGMYLISIRSTVTGSAETLRFIKK